MRQRIHDLLGHIGCYRVDQLKRLRSLHIALVFMHYFMQLTSHGKQVRLRLILEYFQPRAKFIASFERFNIFFGHLKLFDVFSLRYFQFLGFLDKRFHLAQRVGYFVILSHLLVLQLLELLGVLVCEHGILFHESILEVANDLLQSHCIVILLLDEFALSLQISLKNSHIASLPFDFILELVEVVLHVCVHLLEFKLLNKTIGYKNECNHLLVSALTIPSMRALTDSNSAFMFSCFLMPSWHSRSLASNW